MRKILVRAGFVFACLATLIGAVYVVEYWRGQSAWNAYQVEATQRGLKLQLAEYLPAEPAPDQNFAAIPLFQELFSGSKEEQQRAAQAFALPQGTRPVLSDQAAARRIDLAAWARFFAATAEPASDPGDPAAALLAALERYAAPLSQLRAAAGRPQTRFPVQWENGFAALFPHFQVLREALTINVLRMEAHLAQKNPVAAYDDLRFGLRLAAALEKEPVLICGLVRISMLQRLASVVWNGLAADAWDDATLQKIAADFAGIEPLREWQFAMNSERGAVNTVLDQFAGTDGKGRAALLAGALGPDGGGELGWRLLPAGWIRQNQVWLNRYTDEALTQIDPEEGRLRRTKNHHSPEKLRTPLARIYYALVSLIAPAYGNVERAYLAAHTSFQQLGAAIALERYRRARGAYPETLQAAVPEFLPTVPLDVIDAQPLRYRAGVGGRFLLYSIATNRRDDGGAIPETPKGDRPDWVWRYPES